MKRFILLILFALLAAIGVQAQIPAEVTEVMAKCNEAMNNPKGLEYTMDMKVSMGPVTLTNAQLIIGSKGEMDRSKMTMTMIQLFQVF